MFISGVSFALHYAVFQRKNILQYWKDVEFRYYFWLVAIIVIISTVVLAMHHYYTSVGQDFINSLFNVVSVITTTGFTNSDFSVWPRFLPVMIMCAGLIGACGGSTSGGIKVMRLVLVCKQTMREMRRLIHPNGVYRIKFGKQALSIETIEAMWGFIGVYIAAVIFCTLALMATGLDMTSAFGATASALANVGAGIGSVAHTFVHLDAFAKWLLSIAMIAGRLEIFTLLLLFTPAFWQK
jgi:trk system potassium uptake protein TrkH